MDFSRPGKPTDNGSIEAFNSKLRSECLNAHWFMSLADAVEKLEDWRRRYNDDDPQRHRLQRPEDAALSWRCHQPAAMTKVEKLRLQAVQNR